MDKDELRRQGDILYDAEEMGLTTYGAHLLDAQTYGKDEPAGQLLTDLTHLKTLEKDMRNKNYKPTHIQEVKNELIEEIENRYLENVEKTRKQSEQEFSRVKEQWEKERYRDSGKLLMQDRELESEYSYMKSEDDLINEASKYLSGKEYDYNTLRHLVAGLERKGTKKTKDAADRVRTDMSSRGDNIPFKTNDKVFSAYQRTMQYDGLDLGYARIRFGDRPKQVMKIRIRDMIK